MRILRNPDATEGASTTEDLSKSSIPVDDSSDFDFNQFRGNAPTTKSADINNPPPSTEDASDDSSTEDTSSTEESTKTEPVTPPTEEFTFDPFKSIVDEATKKAPEPPANTTTTTKQVAKRSYEGLTDAEAALFKKMDNAAYETLLPIYKEHKELKAKEESFKTSNQTIYERDDAFVLMPEYREAATTVQRAQIENNFWKQQLAKIRAGEKWNELALDEQGQYVLGEEREADTKAEADIISNITLTAQIMQESNNKVRSIASNHKNIYSQSVAAIKQAEDKYFPFYKDPNNPHKALIEGAINSMPPVFRGSPLTPLLAKSYALIVTMSEQLKQAQKELAKRQSIQQDVRKAGPTQTSINNGGGSSSDDDVDVMSMFEKVRMR